MPAVVDSEPLRTTTTVSVPASSRVAEANGITASDETHMKSASTPSFACGIAAGLSVTALLNPWDRALYLSIVNDVPFLARQNWMDPYRGLSQTLLQRAFSSGLYFPLEDLCISAFGNPALGGQAAGALCGFSMNPFSIVKYHTWGAEDRRSFFRLARQMYRDRGPLIFLRGAVSTTCRDMTFGFCFSLRRCLPLADDASTGQQLFASVCCAVAGTVTSAPFNYVRNMSYAADTKVPLESIAAKRTFWRDTMGELFREARAEATYLGAGRALQAKLRLGWGTARVAVGMALTDLIYRGCAARATA